MTDGGVPITGRGHRIVRAMHGVLASGPPWLAKAYLVLLSFVSRNLFSRLNQQRVRNSMYDQSWPAMTFAPRRVVLGGAIEVLLVPHLGEFDEQALYMRHLDYEPAMFKWMRTQAEAYDVIIEIGANVGIYTIFFDALRRKNPDSKQLIVSFEPSAEAYRRLQRNLAINGAKAVTFEAAVGLESGQQAFNEPVGHLTNGSFVRSFAQLFASTIDQTMVETVAAAELEKWLAPAKKPLIKIDVEGFEPALLTALVPLLEKYRPDLLVEVMPSTFEPLEAIPTLARYDRFLVTDEGPRPEKKFYFSQSYFDWFLTWPKEAARPPVGDQPVGTSVTATP